MNSPTTGIRQRAPSLTLPPARGGGNRPSVLRGRCIYCSPRGPIVELRRVSPRAPPSPASGGGMFQAATWLAPPGEDPRNTCKLRDRGSATPYLQARHGLVAGGEDLPVPRQDAGLHFIEWSDARAGRRSIARGQ